MGFTKLSLLSISPVAMGIHFCIYFYSQSYQSHVPPCMFHTVLTDQISVTPMVQLLLYTSRRMGDRIVFRITVLITCTRCDTNIQLIFNKTIAK